MRFHVDTDFLVYGLAGGGPERARLLASADSDAEISDFEGIPDLRTEPAQRGARS